MSKIVCFTGHRPNKIGGYDESNPIAQFVKNELELQITIAIHDGYEHFIHGGALGVDTWAGEIVVAYKRDVYTHITTDMYIPFVGQERMWNTESKERYHRLKNACDNVVICNEGEYAAWKMLTRDKAMVDASDLVIAVWNGDLGKSGTGHTVAYAKKKGKPIIIIDPREYNEGKTG